MDPSISSTIGIATSMSINALHGIHRRGLTSYDLLIDETWRLDIPGEPVARPAQEGSGSEGDAGEAWRFAWRHGSGLSADAGSPENAMHCNWSRDVCEARAIGSGIESPDGMSEAH